MTVRTLKGAIQMRKEEIVGLAVRLFALYIAISTLGNIGNLLAFSKMGAIKEISLSFLIPSISVPLVVAGLLWLVPLTVARKLLPKTTEKPKESPAAPAEYQVIAFSVLGMWVLAQYVPTVFYWLGDGFHLSGNPNESLFLKDYGRIYSTAGGILIGLWLLFGARGLVGLVRYARTAGKN